ncbi:hypothetical protein ABFU14_02995 [Xanthomonas campestris pv. raphani]|uniref:hypothetical protein n=1 Tax=Xanthomonas campestris TaxID=339 RepID=UPI00388EB12E
MSSEAGAAQRSELLVYLDSSDYSQLAEAELGTSLAQVRGDLVALTQCKAATFVYSDTHICEMAPLDSKWTHHAVKRTDLLANLCRKNCLVSIDRLIQIELNQLRNRLNGKASVISRDGTWFPEIEDIMRALDGFQDQVNDLVHEELSNIPQNRKLRRAFASKLRSGLKTPRLDAKAVVAEFAMRHSDAQIIIDYISGKRSKARAEQAFLASFRDPRWMMRWAQDHHSSMSKFITWQRGPAEQLMLALNPLIDAYSSLREDHPSSIDEDINDNLWQRATEESLISIVQNLNTKAGFSFTTRDVEEYCPGISTSVKVLASSLRNSFSLHARKPKASDFVDAIHAIHAPYVDIFRTDGYMAPIVKRHVFRYGTIVVPKLLDLPASIHQLRS